MVLVWYPIGVMNDEEAAIITVRTNGLWLAWETGTEAGEGCELSRHPAWLREIVFDTSLLFTSVVAPRTPS